MTYLPLTRLIAAAGGVALPLMAGEPLAMPMSRTSDAVQSQSVSSGLEPREDIRKSVGRMVDNQRLQRKEIDK